MNRHSFKKTRCICIRARLCIYFMLLVFTPTIYGQVIETLTSPDKSVVVELIKKSESAIFYSVYKNVDGVDISNVLLGKATEIKRNVPLFLYRYASDPICMLREGNMVLLGYQNLPKPRQEQYDNHEEALIKPKEGQVKWAEWSFRPGHMDTLLLQKPQYFELYNIQEDPGQYNDIATKHSKLVEKMKKDMIKYRNEMIDEGAIGLKINQHFGITIIVTLLRTLTIPLII